MKRTSSGAVALVLAVAFAAPAAGDITLTMEEFVGNDGFSLGSFYSGITFTAGPSAQDWIAADISTGAYNASSWPSGTSYGSGQYWVFDNASAWTGIVGGDGRIDFDNQDATYFETGYSAFSSGGGTALFMDAYRADGTLIDSDSGASNLRFTDSNASGPGTLRVDWNGVDHIAWVTIHDTGNFWTIDNMTTNASGITASAGIIPVPGAVWLGAVGLSMVGWLRKRIA